MCSWASCCLWLLARWKQAIGDHCSNRFLYAVPYMNGDGYDRLHLGFKNGTHLHVGMFRHIHAGCHPAQAAQKAEERVVAIPG